MTTAQLQPAPPHVIGPVWRKTLDGGWWLPEKTLGWQVMSWLAQWTLTPGGKHAGKPFLPTMEQARFLAWWYAVDDDGNFIYRSGLLRRLKGWGKDPIAAAISLAELCGPVVFDRWDDETGLPIGKPRHAAWVQIAAVSLDQTKNTFRLFPSMISKAMKAEYGLDVNKTIIYSADGGQIEAVTSSPHSMEGNRPTFVLENEIQWWQENNSGHDMDEVIQGNVTKAEDGGCRILAICNAHVPGQDSVAERSFDAFQKVSGGQAIDTGLLYDSIEAPADTDVYDTESLRRGLEIARGDAIWLNIPAIIASIQDIRRPLSESRRKFLNQVNAQEDSWLSPMEWDACAADTQLEAGDMIAMGFDGAVKHDHSALVACRIADGALFLLGLWDPKNYDGEIPRDLVDAAVHSAMARYKVVACRADVKEYESYVDAWNNKYWRKLKVKASPNNWIAFDMRGQTKRFAFDCEKFHDAVIEGQVLHDGNRILRQQILNAHRNPTVYDAISIRKKNKDSKRKIDAAVCCVLAFAARQDYLASKGNRSRKVVYG